MLSFYRYVQLNVTFTDAYRRYNTDLPQFLQSRPRDFVQHVMKRWASAATATLSDITEVDNRTFNVKSSDSGNEYRVWFGQSQQDMPHCECEDWNRYHWPCKHFCSIFRTTNHGWNDLSQCYRESPYFTIDADVLTMLNITNAQQAIDTDSVDVNCHGECNTITDMETMPDTEATDQCELLRQSCMAAAADCRERLRQLIDMTYLCVDITNLTQLQTTLQVAYAQFQQGVSHEQGLAVIPERNKNCVRISSKRRFKLRRQKMATEADVGVDLHQSIQHINDENTCNENSGNSSSSYKRKASKPNQKVKNIKRIKTSVVDNRRKQLTNTVNQTAGNSIVSDGYATRSHSSVDMTEKSPNSDVADANATVAPSRRNFNHDMTTSTVNCSSTSHDVSVLSRVQEIQAASTSFDVASVIETIESVIATPSIQTVTIPSSTVEKRLATNSRKRTPTTLQPRDLLSTVNLEQISAAVQSTDIDSIFSQSCNVVSEIPFVTAASDWQSTSCVASATKSTGTVSTGIAKTCHTMAASKLRKSKVAITMRSDDLCKRNEMNDITASQNSTLTVKATQQLDRNCNNNSESSRSCMLLRNKIAAITAESQFVTLERHAQATRRGKSTTTDSCNQNASSIASERSGKANATTSDVSDLAVLRNVEIANTAERSPGIRSRRASNQLQKKDANGNNIVQKLARKNCSTAHTTKASKDKRVRFASEGLVSIRTYFNSCPTEQVVRSKSSKSSTAHVTTVEIPSSLAKLLGANGIQVLPATKSNILTCMKDTGGGSVSFGNIPVTREDMLSILPRKMMCDNVR